MAQFTSAADIQDFPVSQSFLESWTEQTDEKWSGFVRLGLCMVGALGSWMLLVRLAELAMAAS